MILQTTDGWGQGEAIARMPDGRVVFIRGAAPREEVEVRIIEDAPSYARAEVVRVVRPGPARVEPACPYVGRCGGCTLQHIELGAQSALATASALQQLLRIGGLDLPEPEKTWTGSGEGFRGRTRWKVSGGRVGYRAAGSNEVVDVERCMVLHPALQVGLQALRARGLPDCEVDAVTDGARAHLHARGLGVVERLQEGVELVERGHPVEQRDRLGARCDAVGAFGQSHAEGNDAMLQTLVRWLEDAPSHRDWLELYAGSGNWTRALRASGARVHAVEHNAGAVVMLRRLGSGVRAVRARAESARPREGQPVLANPPRTGLGRPVVRLLAQARPELMIYVSCEPSTFARDAKVLCASGARLARLRFFDLYPHTPHLELMAALRW